MKNCELCGCKYDSISPKSMYCSDDCRNFVKYKNAMEKILIHLKPCNSNARVIKSDMWRLSNLIRIGTNKD